MKIESITRIRERYRRALVRALVEDEDQRGVHSPSEVARGLGIPCSTAWKLMSRARVRGELAFNLRVAIAEDMRDRGYSRAAIAYQVGLTRQWVARRLAMPGDDRPHYPESWR